MTLRTRFGRGFGGALAAAVVAIGLAGCGSEATIDDPLTDMRDQKLSETKRVEAVGRAWEDGQQGKIDRTTVREDLKTVSWSSTWPRGLRLAALKALFGDTDAAGVEQNRGLVRLMLPREPDRAVVRALADEASQRGWTDATPALVRSLSRVWADVPDAERPEYKAIQRLNPGTPVASVVAATFMNPPEEGGAYGLVPADRARGDAWDLLGRLDTDGTVRAGLIASASDGGKPGPLTDMRDALRELRCLPLTGEELRWLASLHDFADPAKRAWWDQTAAAVAKLEPAKTVKLQLRHLEAIRWASENRTQWLAATREELYKELAKRLAGREMHRRKAREQNTFEPPPEKLKDWEKRLTWADLLTILVIDEGVREKAVVASLFAQADMDREDQTAEYGGVLRWGGGEGGGGGGNGAGGVPGFSVVMYPPRPSARRGDRQFVASMDMIAQSDHALAHYHFHVQEIRNSEFAGPSFDDLQYASRQGRSCVVITSVGSDAMDVDYFQPDGAVVDLGEIKAP